MNNEIRELKDERDRLRKRVEELERDLSQWKPGQRRYSLLDENDKMKQQITQLNCELARLRAQIEGAESFTVQWSGNGLDIVEIDITVDDMQPGETRTFKVVEVEVEDD